MSCIRRSRGQSTWRAWGGSCTTSGFSLPRAATLTRRCIRPGCESRWPTSSLSASRRATGRAMCTCSTARSGSASTTRSAPSMSPRCSQQARRRATSRCQACSMQRVRGPRSKSTRRAAVAGCRRSFACVPRTSRGRLTGRCSSRTRSSSHRPSKRHRALSPTAAVASRAPSSTCRSGKSAGATARPRLRSSRERPMTRSGYRQTASTRCTESET
mmetsp:Transcript_2604/g.4185  ORF Transcript_2604/g.4185 Transcript_2604/m.4185 type:complete len:215 (-) Transcript_2604:198-842(-)